MTVPFPPPPLEVRPRAVLLPGTGSDADFMARAFGAALAARGIELIAVAPDPRAVVAGYLAALDEAAGMPGVLLVGGVSLGAAVVARWAVRQPRRLSGMLIGLPAWLGSPAGAPASLSAGHSAAALRLHGLPAVLRDVHSSSPAWLAEELSRAWRRQWPDLPRAFDEAAEQPGPTEAELTQLAVPTGVVGAVDDAVHPISVARAWVRASPSAHLATIRLAELGAHPAVLGERCLRSWAAACAQAAVD